MSLSPQQLDEFIRDGVLVVENVLSPIELRDAQCGLVETLAQYGIDEHDLEGTGHHLKQLSSTNGSGGVLDIFYPAWKLNVATNPNLFAMTCQLWEAAFSNFNDNEYEIEIEMDKETLESLDTINQRYKWHPYGPFNTTQGFLYMDRIGYRIPTCLAETLGQRYNPCTKKKKKLPLQRSLTPHLDCCPTTMFSKDAKKWRPIQCMVSLTDNVLPNTGGFEAAPGFHKIFHTWAQTRPTPINTKQHQPHHHDQPTSLCIGEYTHIRPTEDKDVMTRMQHIPVPAGSAVFWDNRIPHANSYRNDSRVARAVVYCSFLPNIPLNQHYAQQQLYNYINGKNPNDQWIDSSDTNDAFVAKLPQYTFTTLGRKLMGMDPW